MPKFFVLRKSNEKLDFKTTAMQDKRIKKLFESQEEGAYNIDTSALLQELEDSHLARKYKSFKSEEFITSAQKKLMDWTAEVSRNRGRCVAIKMDCIKISQGLDQRLKDTKVYLLTKYKDELSREHNTIKDKSNAVDTLLEPFNKLSKRLDTVLKICDILLDDLHKSHFDKESMIKILEMNYKTRD